MARGPLLTPDEISNAMLAYVHKGTFEAAAEVIGRDPSVVRRALLRHGADHRLDRMALALTRTEASVHLALDKATEHARRLVEWSSRPGDTPGTVTITVNTLNDALAALQKVVAMSTQLALANERRKLLRARRRAMATNAARMRLASASETPDPIAPAVH